MAEITGRLADLRARLRARGYRFIDFDARQDRSDKTRPDAIAYAANANGDLVPWVAVEVKTGSKSPAAALPRLITARELLGTTDHYAVINGEWYRADRSMRSLEHVDGPQAPPYGGNGFVQDVSLAAALVADRLWFEEDRARRGGIHSELPPLADIFAETSMPGIETPSGEFVAVHPDVLWKARRQAISSFVNRNPRDRTAVPNSAIVNAIALLAASRLGGIALDPFCGSGELLWALMDHAVQLEGLTEFYGQDIDERIAGLAEAIARIGPLPATIRTGDTLQTDLPQANVVVSVPPLGPRLNEPYELMDGSMTRDGDVAAIDRCLRQLLPGGRAVLLVPTSFTYRTALEPYRRFLAHDFRVGAIIGLPQGPFANIGVRSAILVIDRSAAGETFVAQLGEDWQTQLSPEGAALCAAQQHLDDPFDSE